MTQERLRILSANLWNGRADARAFAEQVEQLGVDVAAVQELGHAQADALAEVLPHGRLEPAGNYMGMGVALRRRAEVKRWPLPYRDARCAELDPHGWPGLAAPLQVVNVHILAPHARPLGSAFGVRRQQVRAMRAHLAASPGPRILVGDLNATPVWPVYRRLAGELEDAAHAHARREGRRAARTWGPWSGAPRLLRIDHVLVDGVRVQSVEAVHVEGSDHSALLVDLVPSEAPPAA